MACESFHLITENVGQIQELNRRCGELGKSISTLDSDMLQFKEEIKSKVADVLERTPFQFKEFHTRDSLAKERARRKEHGITPEANDEASNAQGPMIRFTSFEESIQEPPKENLYELANTLRVSLENERDLIVLGNTSGGGEMSASHSQDLLSSASPLFGYIEENLNSSSTSPDNDEDIYGLDQSLTEDFRHGITNINYDFDVSDHSAENSVSLPLPSSAGPDELLSSRLLIEDSPDVLLPSPLQPIVASPAREAPVQKQKPDPGNLLIHK